MAPQFSVFIPTLNSASYLKDTIRSIKDQDRKLFEVIIVDGGSTDETISIVNANHNFDFTVVVERNAPPLLAISRHLHLMKGRYFVFLASDDKLSGDFFEHLNRELLKQDQNFDLIAYGLSYIDEDGNPYAGKCILPPQSKNQLSFYDAAYGPCVNFAISREKIAKVGFFDQAQWGHSSDREYLIRLAHRGASLLSCRNASYLFRKHAKSTTGNGSMESILRDLNLSKEIALAYLAKPNEINCDNDLKVWFGYCWAREILLLLFLLDIRKFFFCFFMGLKRHPMSCIFGFINLLRHKIFGGLLRIFK